ncbi:hypothetical protein GALL_433020 [mine drainage metagenome]|uniref:Uncharacterized protein n=1 Tax=mine drainage metagenome TaxID=410659 RepID=A0A1J5QC23_9ZZZZ
MTEQGGHEAAARADFEHPFILAHREFLQDARLYLGREHVLAAGQGNFGIDKGQAAIGGRDEIFPPHGTQQVEDAGVQHVPGADLLFDHVETGLLDIHRFSAKQLQSENDSLICKQKPLWGRASATQQFSGRKAT